jgi:hypothetical protein
MIGIRASFLHFFLCLIFNLTFVSVSDALMEECVRMMQQSLRSAPSTKKRAKSVYSQRNLGTIKERKKEKQQETEVTSEQTIMRILRMRYVMNVACILMLICWRFSPRTSEFIAQQLQIMSAMQAEQEQYMRESDERKQKRQQQYQQQQQTPAALPPVPEH